MWTAIIICAIVCLVIFVGGMLLYSLITGADIEIEYFDDDFLYLEENDNEKDKNTL